MSAHAGWMKQSFKLCFLSFLALWMATGVDALTKDEENNVMIYKTASKGVVNITSIVVQRDFFMGVVPREGSGSGAIIDKNGHILTNNHVIKDAQRIEVTLSDGSKYPGHLVGSDPDNDLAIIRINGPSSKINVLPFGSSGDLEIGQKVLAIGNPFGLSETLTTGIVSSLGRSIASETGVEIEGLIQTDAAINPGNSGGPLLDSSGRIIGINTAIFSPTGASVGIGFAVPIDTAKRIIPDLIEKGFVSYPWMGVTFFPVTPWLAKALDLKIDSGVLIIEVLRNGPAHQAGLKGSHEKIQLGNVLLPVGGDIIIAIEGKAVEDSEDLSRELRKFRPGDEVGLTVLRRGKTQKVDITLGERPRRMN